MPLKRTVNFLSADKISNYCAKYKRLLKINLHFQNIKLAYSISQLLYSARDGVCVFKYPGVADRQRMAFIKSTENYGR